MFVFSTIDKRPGAPDANRDSDEDLWLSWIVNDSDPSANPVWQITGDEMGTSGDNFGARWSPSGDEVAFIHSGTGGHFEVWRVPVTLPASPSELPSSARRSW
jgi:hypothetical protein